jgi:hypothetical protein
LERKIHLFRADSEEFLSNPSNVLTKQLFPAPEIPKTKIFK